MPKTPEHYFVSFRDNQDPEALARAFDLVRLELFALARRRTHDDDAAADLLQETFLSAIEGRERFDPSARLMPWLRGILLNHYRRGSRDRLRQCEELELEAPERDPSELVHHELLMQSVEAQVEHLPARYREIVRLYVCRRWDPKQIADHLEREPSTVRTQLSRGLVEMRRRLPPPIAIGAVAWLAARPAQAGVPLGAVRPTLAKSVVKTAAVAATAIVVVVSGVWAYAWAAATPSFTQPALAAPPTSASTDSVAVVDTKGPRPLPREDVGKSEATGTMRFRFVQRDGAPLSGLTFRVCPMEFAGYPVRDMFPHWVEATTDGDGLVEISKLPVGRLRILLTDQTNRVVPVRPGRNDLQTISVPALAQLSGVVRDRSGQPVAGAKLWVSDTGNIVAPGKISGQTDAAGRFRVPVYTNSALLWARAPGHGVSTCLAWGTSARADGLELRLTSPVVMRGRVSHRGEPVSRAVVGIISRAKLGVNLFMLTDAEGQFHVPDASPGEHFVAVYARGFGPRCARVEQSQRERIALELSLGATVTGQVVGLSRDAPATFEVNAYPPGVPRGAQGLFRASADLVDGGFEFTDLPAGKVLVTLHDVGRGGRVVGRAALIATAGASHRQDVLMEASATIAARVVGSGGEPIEGAVVHCLPRGIAWNSFEALRTVSDEDGRVRLPNVYRQPYRCWVFASKKARSPSVALDIDPKVVVPDIVLAKHRLPQSSITAAVDPQLLKTGRIVLEGGLLVLPVPAAVDPSKSRVTFENLAAGTYRVVWLGPGGSTLLATARLQAEQHQKLDTLRAAPAGELVLSVESPSGRPVLSGAIGVFLPHGRWRQQGQLDRGVWRAALPAGDYRVRVTGPAMLCAETEVSVRANGVERQRVLARPAQPHRVRVAADMETVTVVPSLRVLVRDRDGQQVFESSVGWDAKSKRFAFDLPLAVGEYELEVFALGVGRAARRVRVESVLETPVELALELSR